MCFGKDSPTPFLQRGHFHPSSLLMLTTAISAALDSDMENMDVNQEGIISSISGARSLQVKIRVLLFPRNSEMV